MTSRQKRFIAEMAACGNISEAARRAGYSEKTARKRGYVLMKNPEIKAGVEKALKEAEKASIANLEEVQEFLTKVLRGQIPGAKTRDRVAAANILQRRYPVELDSGNSEIVIVDDLSDETITVK